MGMGSTNLNNSMGGPGNYNPNLNNSIGGPGNYNPNLNNSIGGSGNYNNPPLNDYGQNSSNYGGFPARPSSNQYGGETVTYNNQNSYNQNFPLSNSNQLGETVNYDQRNSINSYNNNYPRTNSMGYNPSGSTPAPTITTATQAAILFYQTTRTLGWIHETGTLCTREATVSAAKTRPTWSTENMIYRYLYYHHHSSNWNT